MVKLGAESCVNDEISEANRTLMVKVKELLSITKERLKKIPQHPLHVQLKEEFLDLQIETDLNGTTNSSKYLNYKLIIKLFKKIQKSFN